MKFGNKKWHESPFSGRFGPDRSKSRDRYDDFQVLTGVCGLKPADLLKRGEISQDGKSSREGCIKLSKKTWLDFLNADSLNLFCHKIDKYSRHKQWQILANITGQARILTKPTCQTWVSYEPIFSDELPFFVSVQKSVSTSKRIKMFKRAEKSQEYGRSKRGNKKVHPIGSAIVSCLK